MQASHQNQPSGVSQSLNNITNTDFGQADKQANLGDFNQKQYNSGFNSTGYNLPDQMRYNNSQANYITPYK